jgi:hypothetical protein
MAAKGKTAAVKKPKKSSKPKAERKSKAAAPSVSKIAKAAADKAADLASSPIVAEIVAATLVAAAAAIRDPKKARQIAAAAGDELQTATKRAGKGGEAMWQLALDVGRRSLEALGSDAGAKKSKAKKKKK